MWNRGWKGSPMRGLHLIADDLGAIDEWPWIDDVIDWPSLERWFQIWR
jgi:hypothetical protein